MDLGIFLSSKRKMLFWTLGPLLFLVIFYFSFSFYFRLVNSSLRERRDSVELMPVMSRKILMAKTILEPYKTRSSKTDAIQMLNSQLNQMARRTRFDIDSLTVERKPQEGSDDRMSIFEVAIKGEGSLDAVLRFFNETYTIDKLFAVETASLKVADTVSTDFFKADFVFSYYNLQ